MTLPDCETIELSLQDGVLHITLNRPRARNAMNLVMVSEISAAFDAVADDRTVRAVVLRGAERNFCAGGDIKDMAAAKAAVAPAKGEGDPIFDLNRAFGTLVSKVDAAPQVVIACLEGAVLGGGFGLACVSDIAIADANAQFGMPETSLGLPPAQIAPFVVNRIGLTQARRLVLTGARFDGVEAERLGVVHFVTPDAEQMQPMAEAQIARIRKCAPVANRTTKDLILNVGKLDRDTLLDRAAQSFADAVRSQEGHEGTQAFVEKHRPTWAL